MTEKPCVRAGLLFFALPPKLPACPTATHWLRGLCKQLVYHDYFADTCPGKAQIHKEFLSKYPGGGRGGEGGN
jgi:hypothetical protein